MEPEQCGQPKKSDNERVIELRDKPAAQGAERSTGVILKLHDPLIQSLSKQCYTVYNPPGFVSVR
jgi:hypothetical protein